MDPYSLWLPVKPRPLLAFHVPVPALATLSSALRPPLSTANDSLKNSVLSAHKGIIYAGDIDLPTCKTSFSCAQSLGKAVIYYRRVAYRAPVIILFHLPRIREREIATTPSLSRCGQILCQCDQRAPTICGTAQQTPFSTISTSDVHHVAGESQYLSIRVLQQPQYLGGAVIDHGIRPLGPYI
jgi:hypothetical protein